MDDPAQYGPVATLIQAAGILMVAGLLLPMTRAVPGQFLRYWAYGWAAVALSVVLKFASAVVAVPFRPSCLIGYTLGEYVFGFLVWAGCREFATGDGVSGRHAGLFLPFGVCAVALPLLLGDYTNVYPFHALLMGGMCLFAFVATFRRGLRAVAPTVGLVAIRAALLGLAVLFLHTSSARAAAQFWFPGAPYGYIEYLVLVQVLFGTTLAFGMVVLASDRMREELEGKNRQLASASAELATAARTDSLTGLLNRRAFDELAHAGDPPLNGCLAVIDLNDLKILNDVHGHAAGDAALRIVARALANQFRVTDPLFRTGGDEFIAVLAGGTPADLAERMCKLDAALTGQRLPGLREPFDLHVAWGTAGFDGRDEMPAALQRADIAMYAQKRARKAPGSDRVTRPAPAPG